MPRLTPLFLALAGLSGGLVAACGDTGSGEVELVEGVTVDVAARDNVFEPETVEVAPGTEIQFTNDGRNDHNVTAVDDDQAIIDVSTSDLGPGDRATRRLTEPGTYHYYCTIHGTETAGMIGTIVVTEGGP
jgi:plastocyanin